MGNLLSWVILLIVTVSPAKAKTIQIAEDRYGKLHYEWPAADKWLVKFQFPAGLGVGYINRDAAPSLRLIFRELERTFLIQELTYFQGCYNPRPIRNTYKPSTHSYGLACDFNNKRFSSQFIEVWTKRGWCWGGHWKVPDLMHFSYGGFEC